MKFIFGTIFCCWFFFLQFLCYMQKINWILLSVLFVALSHCNILNFLLHWATVTNCIFVCRTDSLRQTKICICYKLPKNAFNNAKKGTKFPKSAKKEHKSAKKLTLLKKIWQYIQILFLSMTQRTKHFFCLLQWFSATIFFLFVTVGQCNKQYWRKKYFISLWNVTKELKKKAKKKHPSKFKFHQCYQIIFLFNNLFLKSLKFWKYFTLELIKKNKIGCVLERRSKTFFPKHTLISI